METKAQKFIEDTDCEYKSQGTGFEHQRIDASRAHNIPLLHTHQTKRMKKRDGAGGIKSLILGDNNIRDEGAISMANALENNEPLESVWIDNSCIGASGLEILARSLVNNKKLKKLHLSHNSFQSLHPLICCTFNKDSLVAIAGSNLTLKYVFLNRRYSYECDEADIVLDTNPKLLPLMCEMLGETSYLSTVFSALRDLSSFVLMFHENKDKEFKNHQMVVDYIF